MRLFRLLLDPAANDLTPGGGGTEAGEPRPQESDLQSSQITDRPAFNQSEAEGGSPGAGSSGLTPPEQPAQAVADPAANPAAWQGIRETLAGMGFPGADRFQSDQEALFTLVQQANRNAEADYYARFGRQLAPHAGKIGQFLQQQQPSQPQRNEWEPPEFDQRWLQLVQRDEATGTIFAKPGVDPSVAQRVTDYFDWQRRFMENPAAIIKPMVDSRAREVADQMLRESFAAREQQSAVGSIMQTNSEWLYAHDQTGQPTYDFYGRPQLSPAGARYATIVETLSKAGVKDVRVQDQLAQQQLRGEIAMAQLQQNQPANPQSQAALNRPNRNPLGAQPAHQRAANPAAPETTTAGMSLSDALRAEMAAAGITDDDIARSLSS